MLICTTTFFQILQCTLENFISFNLNLRMWSCQLCKTWKTSTLLAQDREVETSETDHISTFRRIDHAYSRILPLIYMYRRITDLINGQKIMFLLILKQTHRHLRSKTNNRKIYIKFCLPFWFHLYEYNWFMLFDVLCGIEVNFKFKTQLFIW